jgi:hypothetical protein
MGTRREEGEKIIHLRKEGGGRWNRLKKEFKKKKKN